MHIRKLWLFTVNFQIFLFSFIIRTNIIIIVKLKIVILVIRYINIIIINV